MNEYDWQTTQHVATQTRRFDKTYNKTNYSTTQYCIAILSQSPEVMCPWLLSESRAWYYTDASVLQQLEGVEYIRGLAGCCGRFNCLHTQFTLQQFRDARLEISNKQ